MPQTFNVGARSIFVTVTAWVFIVLAALASASAIVQNAAVTSLMPGLWARFDQEALPVLTGFLLGYLPWVLGAGVAVSMATLGCAIGLLLRLDWARRAFIALLILAIVANLLGVWLQQEVVQSLVSTTLRSTRLPDGVMSVFGGFVTVARVLAVMLTLCACGVLAWIVRRLMSVGVRQEFA
jgi:Zn-dependent protease with chaperone function